MVMVTDFPLSCQVVPEWNAEPTGVFVSPTAVLLCYLGHIHAILCASQTENTTVWRVPIATSERLIAGE
jgi:hypothetical protein